MNAYFLRHGEAGKRTSIPSRDFERSLTTSGQEEMVKIARSMEEMGLEFDKILSSPLARARQTAEIIAKFQENYGKIEDWDELRPEGNRLDLYKKLGKLKQDTHVLLVGHDPYFSTMIGEIISGSLSTRIVLKKGGLARVQITSFSPRPTGELRWLLTPKILRKM